jgi:hypothetical protein
MAGGRPSDYYPELCDEIIAFFNRNLFEDKIVAVQEKGRWVEKKVQVACLLPTVERFAANVGVVKSTLYEWAKKHPEFSNALDRAKELQQEVLIQHGLNGFYKEGFAKFVAVNYTNLKDKVESTVESKNIQINIDAQDVKL